MKYIYILITALSLTSCISLVPNEIEGGKLLGIMPMQHGRVSYQYVHQVKADREAIFRQARRWAAFNMANPSAALNVSDNLLGDVISRGSIGSTMIKTKSGPVRKPPLEYALSIESADNQYRITLTNFVQNAETMSYGIEYRSSETSQKSERTYLKQLDAQIIDIINSVESFITTESRNFK